MSVSSVSTVVSAGSPENVNVLGSCVGKQNGFIQVSRYLQDVAVW